MVEYARLNQIQGFLILIKGFLSLARPIKQLAKKWWDNSKLIHQTTSAVVRTEPNSWNPDSEASRSDGERGLGSQPTSVSSGGVPRMSPSAQTIGLGVGGSINVNGGQCSPVDIPASQLWLDIKASRRAKESEAIQTGMRVEKRFRKCSRCDRWVGGSCYKCSDKEYAPLKNARVF